MKIIKCKLYNAIPKYCHRENRYIININGHRYIIQQFIVNKQKPHAWLTGEYTDYGSYPSYKKALKTIFDIEKMY